MPQKPAHSIVIRHFWTICLLGWTAMLTITISSLMVIANQEFSVAFLMAASLWGPYVLITPLVFRLCRKWPINGSSWRRAIWIHLLASVLCVAVCEATFYWLSRIIGPSISEHASRFPPLETPANSSFPPPAQNGFSESPQPNIKMVFFKAQFGFPLYWVIVALVHALQATFRLQEKERQTAEMASHLSKAQLTGLRTQLQPHFLFNTLNSISALINHDPQMANSMLMNLSDLLRMSLRDSGRDEITLAEELEFIRLYVEIQKMRFGPRLDVAQDIDPATAELLLPAMLLQPIVENAIRHGIEPSDLPEKIRLHSRLEGEWLVLEITNTCPEEVAAGKKQASTGLGLSNTAGRLRAHYGERHRLTAHPVLPGGFQVGIALPAHRKAT